MTEAVFAQAIRNHDFTTLKNLLEKEPGLANYRGSGSTNSWLDLCFKKHEYSKDCECFQMLINHGADVNGRYRRGGDLDYDWTPVMYAVDLKCLRCLKFLIENGADLSIEGHFGRTALIHAVIVSAIKSAEVLIQHSTPALVNHRDKLGRTALMWAAGIHQHDSPSLIQQLIEAGADVNITDEDENTVLLRAVKFQLQSNIQVIIQHSTPALINHRNKKGRTALMWAAAKYSDESGSSICEQLIEAGADVNLKDCDGKTALSIACEMENVNALPLLLQKGAIVNTISINGKTPLYYAFKLERLSVLDQLFNRGTDSTFSLKHADFIHKTILMNNDTILRLLVMNGLPPQDCILTHVSSYNRGLRYTYNLQRSASPLALALWDNQAATARYLITNKFFTRSDLNHTMFHNTALRGLLEKSQSKECIQIFEFHVQTVQTLSTLSLVTISSALTQDFQKNNVDSSASYTEWRFTPTFKERVESLGLPPSLQRALLHQTSSSRICCGQWGNISLEEARQFPDCNECCFSTSKVNNYEPVESDYSESDFSDFSESDVSDFFGSDEAEFSLSDASDSLGSDEAKVSESDVSFSSYPKDDEH